uniref:Portal protein n=1 Tax=viral metagenome TaxID=1070528 RepID=A0A6M3JYT3_9ZZZZ
MNKLWKIANDMWQKGEDKSSEVLDYKQYWEGILQRPAKIPEVMFRDTKKTSHNVCFNIVETKLANILDMQFTVNVLPEYSPFATPDTMKLQNAYADILNAETHNILDRNDFDSIKETVCRWGLIGGFGVSQTLWDTSEDKRGDVKIKTVKPYSVRWSKQATNISETSFVGYEIEINSDYAKELYAKNPDGSYDEELCKKIDSLAGIDISKKNPKEITGVETAQSDDTIDIAYIYKRQGGDRSFGQSKIIKLIVMFIIDNSFYLDEDEKDKMIYENSKMYPNGRIIVFSPDEEQQLIMEDRSAPEAFKNLGNLDFFNPSNFGEFVGMGEIEQLIPIQERINGVLMKIRWLIQNHIAILVAEEGTNDGADGSSYVVHPVKFIEPGQTPPMAISNDTLKYALQLTEYVNHLKSEALETARLNETMVNGMRQTGTTSADQLDVLQESPMSSIRLLQKSFKLYVESLGEKIIAFVHNYYNFERLVSLSTGVNKQFAKFHEINKERAVTLYDEAMKVISTFKVDPSWKFKVKVVAGTEIPRSRRENAMITEKLFSMGVFGDLQDIDSLELYLKSLDFPNYRAIIDLKKKKMEQAAKNPATIPEITQILLNPMLSKSFSEIMKSLEYNSKAKEQLLQQIGLIPQIDKLEDAPIQTIASKADIKEVVAMTNNAVSNNNPAANEQGRIIAGTILEEEKK